MRYKSLSPFVRNQPRATAPPEQTTSSIPRSLLIAVLTLVLVAAPVGYLTSDGSSLTTVGARAQAGNGNGNGNGAGARSSPPGRGKRSPAPTASTSASATPTPQLEPTPVPSVSKPSATATPVQTPAPSAPASSTSSRCTTAAGSAPSGWRRVMSDSFGENIPLGEWARPGGTWEYPGGVWRARVAGWKDSSGRGTYNSMKTTSQHDGLLDVWVHSEDGVRYVSAPIPLVGDTSGQRISLCMRADDIPGYKVAFLLWPSEGPGNYHGESNFPEGRLLTTATAHAFMHYDPEPASGKSQDAYDSNEQLQGWHALTIEWEPSGNTVSFLMDGHLVGRSERQEVPNGPMHYVMQIETYLGTEPLPPPAAGHVLLDWFTIDVPA
jgi:hypothetical protein